MAPPLPRFDTLREYIDKSVVDKLAPLTYGHLSLKEVVTPVRTWIDKMEAWSKGVLADLEVAEKELAGARQQAESFERIAMESEDVTDAYKELVEALRDFDRGIRDWREIHDLLPDPLGADERNPWQRQ